MKIQKAANAIIFAVLLTLTWCITPPELNSLGIFIGKLVISAIIVCGYTTTILGKIWSAIVTGIRQIPDLFSRLFSFMSHTIDLLITKTCEVDLERFNALKRILKRQDKQSAESTYAKPLPWIRFASYTNTLLTFVILPEACYFRNWILCAGLAIWAIYSCNIFLAFRRLTAIGTYDHADSPAFNASISFKGAAFVTAFAFAFAPHDDSLESWFGPYFHVNLSVGEFDISRSHMTILIALIILIFSYSRLCVSINAITKIPEYATAIEQENARRY